ncbi:2TM domain-containing protein [uncultured Hoeflea sp.]|uniref:2TM domain-containing protein n=1 Tax=uncultured Hoeflea sp. TaxID=538666 RepID=UPI0026120BC4|nr:2TM domain-containing protein [uncultured Hoeflea sp.]
MLVRKLRIERGWSQETLAEISDLSVRTIQRVERGGNASLETLCALASVFEVGITSIAKETSMYKENDLSVDERKAVEYVRDMKGFYSHLVLYLICVAAMAVANFYLQPNNLWFIWPTLGWGMGVVSHGLAATELLSFYNVDWERRQIEKWLGRERHQENK